MINIVMIGYSGSGKSTMAKEISEEFKFAHIESGVILRQMMEDEDNKYSKKLKKYILNGKMVPDELVCNIIEEKITENIHRKGIIFDGFPRTRQQAEYLDEKLKEISTVLDFAFLLKIKEKIAIERSLDKLKSIKPEEKYNTKALVEKRIEEQRKHLKELRKYYNRENKLFEYDASTSPDSVQWGIRKIIMRKIEE
ncbi:MAG: adenylate kinase family protein [Bacteroidota bacterium]